VKGALTFVDLARSDPKRLEGILREGDTPSPDALADSLWRGYNVGWPTMVLRIRKFIKGFFRVDRGVEGYNIPVRQNGLANTWQPKPTSDHPKRFGFYLVSAVEPGGRDGRYPHALLLDYGASRRNPSTSPTRVLRDYLIQPDPVNPDVMLGKAYLALGALRIPSSFFVIERLGPAGWAPD
jgi:hypothetical protein